MPIPKCGEFTSIQNKKARLLHRCSYCKGIIDIGEVYTDITSFRYGIGYRTKKRCLYHPINWKKEFKYGYRWKGRGFK